MNIWSISNVLSPDVEFPGSYVHSEKKVVVFPHRQMSQKNVGIMLILQVYFIFMGVCPEAWFTIRYFGHL